MCLGQCLQFQAAKRAPTAAEKADDHRTAIKGFGEADEIADVAPEPEQRRPFTGLYRLPHQTRLHQCRDRALQGCDDARRSAGFESAPARIELRLQGHVTPVGLTSGNIERRSLVVPGGSLAVVISFIPRGNK
jgi:hypothetical protein